MKLNFWQWLGVALLVVALILVLTGETDDPQPAPKASPATTPAINEASTMEEAAAATTAPAP